MSVDTFADDDGGDEPEGGRYYAIYDGLPGPAPGGEGATFIGKKNHPPLYCPAPTIMTSARGLYRCPGCGAKVRHSSHIPVRERAYEIHETVGEVVTDGLTQAWDIAWPALKTLIIMTARAVAWMARTAGTIITRHRQETQNAALERHPAQNRPGPESQAPETEESSSEKPDEPPDNPQDDRTVTCITSDGIHVIKISDGQVECVACGAKMAGKEA